METIITSMNFFRNTFKKQITISVCLLLLSNVSEDSGIDVVPKNWQRIEIAKDKSSDEIEKFLGPSEFTPHLGKLNPVC